MIEKYVYLKIYETYVLTKKLLVTKQCILASFSCSVLLQLQYLDNLIAKSSGKRFYQVVMIF